MKLLTNTPLIEATCEIVFMPTPTFDTTLPGILYTGLKEEFPIKRDQPGGMVTLPSLTLENSFDIQSVRLSQFFSSDNTQAVQIGKDVLVNNMTAPYKGWNIFKAQILKVLTFYSSNFADKPEIRKVTLKYINVLHFDIQNDYIENFTFNLPNPPEEKYKKNRAFNTNLEYDLNTGDILSLSFKSVYPPDISKKSVALEITNQHIVPRRIELDNFENWLDQSHQNIEELFVSSLKAEFLDSLT